MSLFDRLGADAQKRQLRTPLIPQTQTFAQRHRIKSSRRTFGYFGTVWEHLEGLRGLV
jgi:hypothetical protein